MWKYIRNIINRKQFLLIAILFVALGAIVYAATYYRVNAGIAKEVDEFGICKKVSNLSAGPDTFVPTKTDVEWEAFVSNTPSNISISACVVGGGGTPATKGTRSRCECSDGFAFAWQCTTSPMPASSCAAICAPIAFGSINTYCSTLCNNTGCS